MCHSSSLQNRARAFTLMELLVVIGLIAVLASILLPVINTARAQSDAVKCTSSLRQLGSGITGYTSDHDGHLPGPLEPLVYAAYSTRAETATSLVKIIGSYIGVTSATAGATTTKKAETVTTCPAMVTFAKGAEKPSYVLNFADKLPDLNQVPWGDGDAQPVQLSVLTAWRETRAAADGYEPSPTGLKNLTRLWAIKDVDRDAFIGMNGGAIADLPDRPLHGDFRNALFYDWHVGKIDLKDNPK